MPSTYTGSKLTFPDKFTFDLFIEYLKGIKIDDASRLGKEGYAGQSLYDYFAEKVDSEKRSIVMQVGFGKENIIGKFFLETGFDLPKGFTKESTHEIYKQPVMSLSDDELAASYARGVPKIMLARQGEATIPSELIKKLQSAQSAKASLTDTGLSLFHSTSILEKNTARLATLMQQCTIGFAINEWKPLLKAKDGVSMPELEVGISNTYKCPSLATPKLQVLLNSDGTLTVLDKTANRKELTGEARAQAIKTLNLKYEEYLKVTQDKYRAFVQQQKAHEEILKIALKTETTTMKAGDWKPLTTNDDGSTKLEVGISGRYQKPSLATPDFQVILDPKGNLLILDKNNSDKELTGKARAEAIEQLSLEYTSYEATPSMSPK